MSARAWLLLLLIALLPIRGSFAAAVLCHDATARGHAHSHATAHHGHMQGTASDHESASAAPEAHGDHAGTADKCNLCSSLTTPACPLDAASDLGVALPASGVVSQPTVWPPSFVSAGLKRPPRSA